MPAAPTVKLLASLDSVHCQTILGNWSLCSCVTGRVELSLSNIDTSILGRREAGAGGKGRGYRFPSAELNYLPQANLRKI